MTTWTPAQQAVRDEWGLDELEREPSFFATVDPMRYPPRPPAGPPKLISWPTPAEDEATIARYRHEVPLERARLSLVDPNGEAEAVAPLSEFGAGRTLLEAADQDAARKRVRVSASTLATTREPGRSLLDRLGADPSKVRGVMRCPAHHDRSPSLSWRLAPNGKALLRCWAGCSFREIVASAR